MAKILLAEDDSSLRSFVTSALEKAGYKVTPCADGEEALRALEQSEFDLLLTDIVMPGIDGIELSAKAARMAPKTKIMFITGFAAMATGATDERNPQMRVISKPFHLGGLIGEVEKILSS